MLKITVLLALAMTTLKDYYTAPKKAKDEAGLGTLEMVVIGLGLLLFATAAVAVFKGAIDSRLDKIK